MKKVTAFVGSARKQHTYNAVCTFLDFLQSFGDIECEIVRLSECQLETCRGCKLCLDRGEELCPFKDDRDLLIGKMLTSDGVVFASPNYSFQVSAVMKKFLDRLGFVFHRPRFFGKTFTSIVVQGIYGGPKIVEYLDFVGNGLGFNVVKGTCLRSLEPISDDMRRKNEAILKEQSRRFYDRLSKPPYSVPSLSWLMIFRMSRTSIRLMLDEKFRDYTYYREQGWFESDYFYPVRLGVFRKVAGNLFDYAASRSAKKGATVANE